MDIFEDGTVTLKLIGEAGKTFPGVEELPSDAQLARILRALADRLDQVGADDSRTDEINTIPVIWANVSFGA